MVVVAPFAALRPRPELAKDVASVPYDVVDTAEARALAEGNPQSYLHVTRPEIDMPLVTDPHSEAVYQAGRATLARFVAEGTLVRDPVPALYVYRLTAGHHSQVGVMGCCAVDEYDDGTIKKHEKTRPDKEDDRTHHLLTLGCHPEPVFLTCRAEAEVSARVTEAMEDDPLYAFTAADGVNHEVWRLAGPEAETLCAAFAEIEALYVADGHHRCAAASRARAELRGADGDAGPANRFLAVVFPDDQVAIQAYNRVVHDLNGHSPDAFLAALREVMEVDEEASPEPPGRGRFSMYLGGRWYGLTAPAEHVGGGDPVESLDAAILQNLVLAPILGIEDPRTAQRISFVGGIRGTGELERLVDALAEAGLGPAVAFSLHPVSMAELMAVADAGRVLPPKSTWFEPKLRSGLAIHELTASASQGG